MPSELRDMEISRISLVRKPANRRPFLLLKQEHDDDADAVAFHVEMLAELTGLTKAEIETRLSGAQGVTKSEDDSAPSAPSFKPGEETLEQYKDRLKKWEDEMRAWSGGVTRKVMKEEEAMDDFERLQKADDASEPEPVPSNRKIQYMFAAYITKHEMARRKDPSYQFPEEFRVVYAAHRQMVLKESNEAEFLVLMKSATSIPHLAALMLEQM